MKKKCRVSRPKFLASPWLVAVRTSYDVPARPGGHRLCRWLAVASPAAMKSAKSTATEPAAMEPTTTKSAGTESTEMVLSEVPAVEVVITSPDDYSAAIIGSKVTVVGTFIRTKVRTRTETRSVIVAGASAQQKNRECAAG